MAAVSFTHWSPLQTLLVWVLGACVAGVVWYAVFYRDALDAWQVASNDLHAAEKDLEKLAEDDQRVKSLTATLAADAEALARDRQSVPGGDGHAEDPLWLVPGLAATSWLSIERWSPLAEAAEDVLLRIPVQVDARGSWGALTEFLRRVASLPQIVSVERLSVHPGADARLEIGFVVQVSRLREAPRP